MRGALLAPLAWSMIALGCGGAPPAPPEPAGSAGSPRGTRVVNPMPRPWTIYRGDDLLPEGAPIKPGDVLELRCDVAQYCSAKIAWISVWSYADGELRRAIAVADATAWSRGERIVLEGDEAGLLVVWSLDEMHAPPLDIGELKHYERPQITVLTDDRKEETGTLWWGPSGGID